MREAGRKLKERDRQKRADQRRRLGEQKKTKQKKNWVQIVLDCKLRAERRNKLRHLAEDRVKASK